MHNLKDIVRRGREGPALMFRAKPYDLENPDDFLADISALANADIVGQRALIIGVSPGEPDKRKVPGLSRDKLPDASAILSLIETYIEPSLNVQVLAPGHKARTLLVILLQDCNQPPYVMKESCGVLLKGAGFIRRQDQNLPLGREESDRLRRRDSSPVAGDKQPVDEASESPTGPVSLVFPDGARVLSLAALSDSDLPSSLAARKLEGAIKARKDVEAMSGLDTGIVRLMHVRAFGQDEPFAKKSIEELEDDLRAVQQTFEVEDKIHLYEKTGFRLNFILRNESDQPLEGVVLNMRIQRVYDFEVAPCIYTTEINKPEGRRVLIDSENPGYPSVRRQEQFFEINREIGNVPARSESMAFPEPLRIVVRESAPKERVKVSYELRFRGAESPVKGRLELRLIPGEDR